MFGGISRGDGAPYDYHGGPGDQTLQITSPDVTNTITGTLDGGDGTDMLLLKSTAPDSPGSPIPVWDLTAATITGFEWLSTQGSTLEVRLTASQIAGFDSIGGNAFEVTDTANLDFTDDYFVSMGLLTLSDGNDTIHTGDHSILFFDLGGGNDVAVTSNNVEVISGGTGDDIIYAGGGTDEIHGDEGSDILAGEGGDDALWSGNDAAGEHGIDFLDGGEGNDILHVNASLGAGSELAGGAGTDTIDIIETGLEGFNLAAVTMSGVERIHGAYARMTRAQLLGFQQVNVTGITIADGGAVDLSSLIASNGLTGLQNLFLSSGGNDVNLTGMTTGVFVSGALDSMAADSVRAGSGDDQLNGGAGNDVLRGNGGNDRIDGLWGADRMEGGAGDDTYVVDDIGDRVIEDAGNGTDTVQSSISFTLGANVEVLTLTGTAAINGTGGSGNNIITGNGAANALRGMSGDDVLDGGAGADTMAGGKGDDVFYVDNAGDKVIELDGEGSETVYASVSYSIAGQYIEALTLVGTVAVDGTGNGLNNRIIGNGRANTLVGGDGNDVLDGGLGADTLKGGTGNDTYVVDQTGDKIVENDGEGTDTVEAYFSYSLAGQYIEILKLMGTGDFNGNGNSLANTLYGNSGANVLNGMAGADTMYGGAGNDTYYVDNTGDKIFENANEGNDTVQSSVTFSINGQYIEALVLTGTAAINGTGNSLANVMTGNSAANVLNGLAGDDKLHGGLGSDTLTGGAGADSFWFETALGASNVDTITDFNVADDTITLDRTIFSGIAADGALDPNAFWQGTAAHDADDRIVYDKATGKIWYDADGSGAGAAVLFAQVTANTALTVADFFAVP